MGRLCTISLVCAWGIIMLVYCVLLNYFVEWNYYMEKRLLCGITLVCSVFTNAFVVCSSPLYNRVNPLPPLRHNVGGGGQRCALIGLTSSEQAAVECIQLDLVTL